MRIKNLEKISATLFFALLAACGSNDVAGVDEQPNSIAEGDESSSSSVVASSSSVGGTGTGSPYSSSGLGDDDPPDAPFDPDAPQDDIKLFDFSGAALDSVYAYIAADRIVHEEAPGNCGMPECDYHTVSGSTATGYLSLEEQLYSYTVECNADFNYMYEVRNEFNVIKKKIVTTSLDAVNTLETDCAAEGGAYKSAEPATGTGYAAECEIKLSDNPGDETEYVDSIWKTLALEIANKCHD